MLFFYIPVQDHNFIAFPLGNIHTCPMTLFTPHRIGQIIKAYRLEQKLTQAELAHLSGTGLRFIVELERGKPTVQLGKMLQVFGALGLEIGVSRAKSTAAAGVQPNPLPPIVPHIMPNWLLARGTKTEISRLLERIEQFRKKRIDGEPQKGRSLLLAAQR
jgi:HTH-type transcriptional regulator / antitoxin HipB